MLKRLELVGFKSFADKTIFDFGDGVTAIVGPNGSGKSNIVDAVRWILGEQSAKSLRGGEMADVIFNGSTVRRSLGLAEVTLTFDNRRRQLSLEAEEVQITRRVYRDGQGEYLLNGQICRLRDIKDLFLGSGAGHDAYCVIEQGKVDVLLQASNKERRNIFEEAAGISRFKAKKIETLRKLERVDQNLARVKDIIDEVEKQLRSVKLQAAKAQRFQEYSIRLKELRLGLGLVEFRDFTQKLDAENHVLDQLRGELDQRAARAGACEAEAERLEMLLADLDDNLRDQEAHLARVQQHIKTQETTLAHETALSADLEIELDRMRRQLADLSYRLGALADAVHKAEEELEAAQDQAGKQRDTAQHLEKDLHSLEHRLDSLSQQTATDKGEHLEQMRRAARLQNDVVAAKSHFENLQRDRDRLRHKSDLAAGTLACVDVELRDLTDADQELHGRLTTARQTLEDKRLERERLRQARDDASESISQLRQERSGVVSRIEVLEGMIKSHEGLGAGVREVFGLLEQSEPGPWQSVLGMLADFLTVKRDYAALIDLALGDWAHCFLVRDMNALEQGLSERSVSFAGRVSFMPLAAGTEATPAVSPDGLVEVSVLSKVRRADSGAPTPDHPGLVAPAEQLVSCDHPDLADLPARLLGRTLIVRDLGTARAIAEHAPGFRLVTLHGELLEPDGTLTVGTHRAEAGILSRKSELTHLQEQVAVQDRRIAETGQMMLGLRDRMVALDLEQHDLQKEIEVLSAQAADLRARALRHSDKRQDLFEEVTGQRDEMVRIEQDMAALEKSWHNAHAQAEEAEEQVQKLHGRIAEAEAELRQCEAQRHEQQLACTQAQVLLAKAEERQASLGSQHRQLAADLAQRRADEKQRLHALENALQRLSESQRTMLAASAHMAQAYLEKESAQRQVAEICAQRDQKRQDRARLAQQAQAARNEWRAQQEQFHARELAASELRHQRDTLIQRLREDYQVDLADLTAEGAENAEKGKSVEQPTEGVPVDSTLPSSSAPSAFSAFKIEDPAAAQEEIEELRRKLSRLGSVNLEALDELQELDKRAADLHAQFDDLTGAKKSLEEIIAKINLDSRKIFVEMFNAVRGHFQELFRKLFGGGMADVVLEDENDVLETGIEIIARPPGKELRTISLMSGGEKTLTAVALLLAIFRSKPSPFCILDEVDAALDEANIGRYCAVLREFQEQSQFIIVTHSKKTMAAADVLYGITMQESGISKQVAVRFEDWVEEEQPEAAAG
ncbi:MAG: chromosome segregation protein SMC [Gemmataceae bacterium]|nr:chromosome segregation protein SMC [Gemmataceae bacterium]MCI0743421.1 chromosome segregation protein SMC [Gemmataceae bacterium]